MKKAYCAIENFQEEAKNILENHQIQLVMNTKKDRPNGEELINLLKEYDILIIGIASKLTSDMLQYIDRPKIIATLSIGVDHIDDVFFKSPLVKIINIQSANTVSVAEHIFSLILALNKRLVEANQLVIEKRGHKNNLYERPEDISNKMLGLIGAGGITQEVIKIANAFHMKLKCYTPNPAKHKQLLKQKVEFVTLDEILEESDIINVSIPLNTQTKNLISKDKIAKMKPTATFINTSREEIVDTKALLQYADLHPTFYIGLDIDVKDKELFTKNRKNVMITPHIAGVSKQAMERMDIEIANKIILNL